MFAQNSIFSGGRKKSFFNALSIHHIWVCAPPHVPQFGKHAKFVNYHKKGEISDNLAWKKNRNWDSFCNFHGPTDLRTWKLKKMKLLPFSRFPFSPSWFSTFFSFRAAFGKSRSFSPSSVPPTFKHLNYFFPFSLPSLLPPFPFKLPIGDFLSSPLQSNGAWWKEREEKKAKRSNPARYLTHKIIEMKIANFYKSQYIFDCFEQDPTFVSRIRLLRIFFSFFASQFEISNDESFI